LHISRRIERQPSGGGRVGGLNGVRKLPRRPVANKSQLKHRVNVRFRIRDRVASEPVYVSTPHRSAIATAMYVCFHQQRLSAREGLGNAKLRQWVSRVNSAKSAIGPLHLRHRSPERNGRSSPPDR